MSNVTLMEKLYVGKTVLSTPNGVFVTELHNTKNGSDKRYFVAVMEEGNGLYTTACANGRSGSAYVRAKSQTGLDLQRATSLMSEIIKDKQRGGYLILPVGAGASSFATTQGTKSSTVQFDVELLTAVDSLDDCIKSLAGADQVYLQRKLDGMRVLASCSTTGTIEARSRSGASITLDVDMRKSVLELGRQVDGLRGGTPGDLLFDCELVGATLHVFDWSVIGDHHCPESFWTRHVLLASAYKNLSGEFTSCLEYVGSKRLSAESNQAVFDGLCEYVEAAMEEGAEGIVIRDDRHRKLGGRNPHALKLKFTSTADVMLTKAKGRSMEMLVHGYGEFEQADHKGMVSIGRVTIPGKQPMPKDGSIAEVRYLYRSRSGPLQQPVFLRLRDDLTAQDCQDDKVTRYKDEPILPPAYLSVRQAAKAHAGEVDLMW